MNQNNQVQKGNKMSFNLFMTNSTVQKKVNEIIGGQKGQRFITAIISAVNNNEALKECEHTSIFNAALLGETLNLSPSPQLGHYYLVPFKNTKKGVTEAQFQLGYKGYIQLAIRSGKYKKINVLAIKEGELIKYDPLNEEIEVNLIQDELEREKAKTIGYYAMFEHTNGYRKAMYWSKEKMEAHALKYSKGYQAKKGYTFWEKDFDGMAYKTMLRQLISKWGIMSIDDMDMQNAIENDMAVIHDDGKEYVDNQEVIIEQAEESNTEPTKAEKISFDEVK